MTNFADIATLHKPSLSIVIPCYNPAPSWLNAVKHAMDNIVHDFGDIELVAVNDGSSNQDLLKGLESIHPSVNVLPISYKQNKGKGYALREGVKAATGDIIIYTDVDFPYTHSSFVKIAASLNNNNSDVAVGIRGEEYYSHLPKARVRISKILRWFIKKFLRIPTDDTQCGLKGFNQNSKKIFLATSIDRYLFDLEFIYLAAAAKLKIETVEVELRPEVQLSTMNWKILLQEGFNFLRIFLKAL